MEKKKKKTATNFKQPYIKSDNLKNRQLRKNNNDNKNNTNSNKLDSNCQAKKEKIEAHYKEVNSKVRIFKIFNFLRVHTNQTRNQHNLILFTTYHKSGN